MIWYIFDEQKLYIVTISVYLKEAVLLSYNNPTKGCLWDLNWWFCGYSSNEMWWSGTTRRTSPNLCLWKKTRPFRNTDAGSVSSTVRTAHDCATSTTLWTSERHLCFSPYGLLKGQYQYFLTEADILLEFKKRKLCKNANYAKINTMHFLSSSLFQQTTCVKTTIKQMLSKSALVFGYYKSKSRYYFMFVFSLFAKE